MSKSRTFIEQLCHALGKNNDASYAVVAVATAKGIFRPMFTMMDKEQDYETKKYTAMREGLTEAIAIPCYLTTAWAAKNIAAPLICKSAPNETIAKAGKTLSFLGVCAAALIIIPASCSVLITPIMNFLKEHNIINDKKPLDITSKSPAVAVARTLYKPQTHVLPQSYAAFRPMSYNTNPLKIGGTQ